MRGAFCHNQLLVLQPALALKRIGFTIQLEYPIRLGKHIHYIDFLAELGDYRIAGEAENSSVRILNDYHKALAATVNLLLIITPNKRINQSVYRRLRQIYFGKSTQQPTILCLTLGATMQLVTNKSHLFSALNVRNDFKTNVLKTQPLPPKQQL